MEAMKSIVYNERGDASVLHLVERAVPEPTTGELRIRIMVSGVNPTDWKTRHGLFGGDPGSTEFVPNQDGSGVVDAVGPGVNGFSVGDRVWIVLAAHDRPSSGTAQEFTVVPVERVFPLPDRASFDLGASIGVPAITAHRALTVAEDGPTRLHPGAFDGTTVLVAGGAGAVGNAAIQLARWAGATVIATVSSAAKAAYATAAGAHHVVNYRDVDVASQLRRLAPAGVDLIVEVAIDANLGLDLDVLRPKGTISSYAANADGAVTLNIRQNMGLNTRYQFVLLYTVGWDVIAAAATDINAAIEDSALVVGDSAGLPLHYFTLEQAADAHRAVESGVVGKVLIRVDARPGQQQRAIATNGGDGGN
ncbi:MAG: Oxidoreductase [Glaciihabitans sp.]|nr:Oxidoreductase [Glaciihabitans sp.]MDQ1569472.1 NADPH:quinone reductase [Actinomycetota bacterium]